MNDANFRAEGMVYYSTQFPREDSATWWDMHRSINNNRACKICGDVGHTYKEHQGQCPYCDASHPFEQCPTSQVTCFLCEGNNHIPALCQLYPTVQQMNRQISDGMEQALEKMHEHTRSTTKAEDSVKPCTNERSGDSAATQVRIKCQNLDPDHYQATWEDYYLLKQWFPGVI